MRAVYEHGQAVIVRVASSSVDPRVHLSAAQFLIGEAERPKKLEAAGTPDWTEETSRERIIAESRELFAWHLAGTGATRGSGE